MDKGRVPSRSRREVLAGLGVTAAAWTAPQVISVSRAGAATEHTITLDIFCNRTDGGGPVPFTWTCSPNVGTTMSRGGSITIATVGCVPVETFGGGPPPLLLTPMGSGTCANGSPPNSPFDEPGVISGSSIFFANRFPGEQCTYASFIITVSCSS